MEKKTNRANGNSRWLLPTGDQLKKKLVSIAMERTLVAALYRFVSMPHHEQLQKPLQNLCDRNQIRGTLLLAAEGINGTIAGPRAAIEELLNFLRQQPELAELNCKFSHCDTPPFLRMKVRLKREIVSMGDPEIDPTTRVGTYVDPEQWNRLLEDPEVLVLDTRNDYEVRVGSFEGALNPKIANFSDFPKWAASNLDQRKSKKVAMFCTGGIRCEKASSLLLREGFEEVYHLEGGILRYLEHVNPSNSKWQGECFVFDQRVTVDHQLEPGQYSQCYGCQGPVSFEEAQSPYHEDGVCCVHCHDRTPEHLRERRRERSRQVQLAKQRGQRHIGR